jgi:hypothetical protein
MGFASAQPIQPRSSPGVVAWFAGRTGRQTSGAARWATGRRAIAGGDGATRITGGDGAPRIIGRRIGMTGATMHGRGRCRDGGAENDCGGQRDCCPARHCRISGLSCRGLAPSGPTALSCLVKTWGWRPMTPSASGWVVRNETHQIPASRMWISRGSESALSYCPNPRKLVIASEAKQSSGAVRHGLLRRFAPRNDGGAEVPLRPPSPRQNPSAPCASYPAQTR